MAQTTPLIERDFLEKLERLTIHWHRSFAGLIGGHHSSRFPGPGQEFFDHRHFHHGDDLRSVNWRAYLRLEKLFMKMFQVEPRVPVRLLLDSSLSMATPGAGGAALTKFDYARKLAAALCYVGLVRLDTIVLQPFREGLGESFSCGGGRHRFLPAVQFLTALEERGSTNYLEVSRQFLSRYPQRGLVILISDFFDDAGVSKPLQYITDFGHELLLIQLWADADREPPWDGELDLVDAETGEKLELSFDRGARERYRDSFDAWARTLETAAQRSGGRYVGLSTSVSLEDAIFGSLIKARGVE
jgi:uncharacterized protein (DUF58 family)